MNLELPHLELPTLEQTARLSRFADPARWPERPGHLPPLAGAGGFWQLFVGPSEQIAPGTEVTAINERLTFPALQLTGGDNKPPLMQRWRFTNLYVPVGFYISKPEAESESIIATLTLKRNGDIVYTTTAPQTEVVNTPVLGQGMANVIFTADLNNSFTLDQGQQLSLEVSLLASRAITAAPWKAFIGSQVVNTLPLKRTTSQGTLSYESIDLTGHRRL